MAAAVVPNQANGVNNIGSIIGVLKTLKSPDVTLSRDLLRPLYSNTPLDRRGDDGRTNDEIVRKNVYYLAHLTKNVTRFIIEMVQNGLFSLDQRDDILKEPEELQALVVYCMIFKLNAENLPEVVEILRETGNDEIVNLLQENRIQFDGHRNDIRARVDVPVQNVVAVAALPQLPVLQTIQATNKWACPHCTFENTQPNICEVCAKSKDPIADVEVDEAANWLGQEDEADNWSCQTCTFVNPSALANCEVCGELKINFPFQPHMIRDFNSDDDHDTDEDD